MNVSQPQGREHGRCQQQRRRRRRRCQSQRQRWSRWIGSRFAKGPVACLIAILIVFLAVVGCATYQTKVQDARDALRSGNASKAAKDLQPLAEKQSDDQLVYMLDYAVALQDNDDYKQSAKWLGDAEKVADIQDYHSLTRIASSLVLSAEMVQYKGDDFEKVLINGVNVINYLMMGQLDDAEVEVRRLNEKLYKYKYEAKRNYEQNPYAFYLNAIIWEADRRWDDAYIDYKKAYELEPGYLPLHEDLVRAAIKAQRSDDVKEWMSKFPEVHPRPEWKDPSVGELVLVYQQGWGPRKYPRPGAPRFPKLFPVPTNTKAAELEVDDNHVLRTQKIFSVQDVAIKTLEDDYAALVATRVGGVVAKAVVADQIRQRNALLGDLTFLALNAADRADLRQWSTLPETFQIARMYLPAGKHRVKISGLTTYGTRTGEQDAIREIDIAPGKKTFLAWRSFR